MENAAPLAGGGGERGTFYGDRMSLVSARPEGSGDKKKNSSHPKPSDKGIPPN